jgi:hypothetical protein
MVARHPKKFPQLEAAIIDLLPPDGTPVLNRVMRVMLARRLEERIDDDQFFEARDALLASGRIGRLRGQGGQLFLTKPKIEDTSVTTPFADDTQSQWTEARLMVPLERFLKGPFCKALDLPESGACIVQNTSVMGANKGKWARPDFILVSAMRFKLLPGAQVDLHSFELKTEAGGSVLAIHEALAQTRFTHFGHFVWHLPTDSKCETMLDDITSHCDEHGIGLIRMRDPERAVEDGCEILLDPRRKATLGATIDGFLETRLSAEQKAILLRAVGGDRDGSGP